MTRLPLFARTLRTAVAALAICAIAGTMAGALGARAEVLQADESKLKAAFIYYFIAFSEWPSTAFADSATPIELCVLGTSPLWEQLKALQEKTIQGRAIHAREAATAADAATCQVLYVDERDAGIRTRVLRGIADRSVLTVSSDAGFTDEGGMIMFAVVNSKVTFQINMDAVKRAGMRLSSKLLNLATNVH